MSAVGQATPDDGLVKAIYRDGNVDPEPDPEAVPAVLPETEGDADVRSFTLEVDGEMFSLRPGDFGGTDYTWLSGPTPGYGFSMSPTRTCRSTSTWRTSATCWPWLTPPRDTSKTTEQ